MEYEYRVYAENIVGIGKVSKVSEGQVARDPCDPPGTPEATKITKDSVTIVWTKPEYDGGAKVTGYIVEKKELPEGRWLKANFTNVIETEYVATGLVQDNQYEFRVIARNAAGVFSLASFSTGPITARDEIEPPRFSIDPEYTQTVVVNAGDNFKIDADVNGKPLPSIHWMKGELELGNTIHREIKNTPTKAFISVKEAKLSDGGEYTLLLKNPGGEKAVKAEEEQWTMVTPPTGLRVNKYEITKLTEGQEYKIQVCALNKLGVGEPASLSGTAKPEERVEPPEIHLDSELRKGIVVKAGGSVRIHVPFKGRPTPEIKWTKDEGDLNEKAVVEKALNFTQLSLDSCDRSDSGKYALSLTNSSGTVSEVVSVKVLDTPGAPQSLVVKDVKRESVTLVWDAPLIDGGSKIKNYVIDKRESTRKAYANVSTKCTKTTFKVENLIEGAMYYFRVMAENEFGIGQAVETKTASKASEVPLPVGKVFLTDVTKATVSLAWEKPQHDGGSRIGGYLIEMLPKGTDKWGVATNTKTCDGTVKGLTAGAEYLFRVIAFNEKGKSEPKALAAPVIASDMTMEPSIKMQFNTYSVLAGKDLKLEFPVLGRPKPKVTWSKDGQALKVTSRVNVLNTPETAVIQITEACKEDFGKYSITATNNAGTVTEDVAVIILDKPGPPTGPVKVVEVSNTFVHLSWEPPEYTGGCQVKNYIVEKRDTTTTTWQPVTTQLARTAFKVTKLKTGAEYQFRIIAENRYGKGVSLDSKAIVTLVDLTKTSVSLAWEKPAHDGGSKVMCYNVEFKPKTGDKWGTACTVKVPEATVPNLTPNEAYLFRVVAINEKGKSEPKDLGLPVVAKDVGIEPSVNLLFNTYSVKAGDDLTLEIPIRGRPKPVVSWKKDGLPLKQTSSVTILNTATSSKIVIKEATREHVGKYEITLVDAVSSDSITLSWSPPEYDGGCSISNYIVEKRDTNTQEWQMAASNVARTAFKAGRLTHGAEYQFRIYAVNRYGKSTYLDSPGITAMYNFKQPGPPSTPIVKLATKSYMLVTWNEPVSDGGSPVLGYHLERKERSSILWTKMNRGMIKDTEYKVNGIEEGMIFLQKSVNSHIIFGEF
uniref:Titin n=1 Tax=Acanthochromis polyacanthus TaxID=80966 RepID=A0A3Q1F2W1_9TELE